METFKLTAKEIADDAQQTYNNIPCSYRQILEDRIIEHAKQESAELLEALIKAKAIIKIWHDMGHNKHEADYIWNIYENRSPEMKPINEAIKNHLKQKMITVKLENRTIVTSAKTFEEYKLEQKHNYPRMPAKVRNSFMLRDWKKIKNFIN